MTTIDKIIKENNWEEFKNKFPELKGWPNGYLYKMGEEFNQSQLRLLSAFKEMVEEYKSKAEKNGWDGRVIASEEILDLLSSLTQVDK